MDRLISRGLIDFVGPSVNDGIAVGLLDGVEDSLAQFRAVFGREHEGEASFGLLGEPGLGFLGYMGGVIVEDELDRSRRRISRVELFEERDELAGAVSFLDAGMDSASQEIDAGQQAQGPQSDVFMIARNALMAHGPGGRSGAVVASAWM